MGRWLARGVAIVGTVGIGGVVALGGGAAAFAEGAPAAGSQDPLSSLTKQLPVQLPSLPGLDPKDLTKQLQEGAKALPLQLPTGLPALPTKLPLDLSGLVPKTPLVCGVGVGIGGPINGSCPGSGQKVVTQHGPKETRTIIVPGPAQPGPTKFVHVPVSYQQPVAAAPSGKLAYTGFETTPVLAAGLAALIGGVVLTSCARPRRASVKS